ncbi:MAG: SH3 domain-containing protein, partial [Actinomycetota bacterium]
MPLTRRFYLAIFTVGVMLASSTAVGAQTDLEDLPPGVTTLADVAPGTHEVTDVPAGLELRVRELPGTDQDILFTLPNETIVRTTGERAQTGSTVWLQIQIGGTIGWSSATYLTALTTETTTPTTSVVGSVTTLDAVDAGTHEVTDVPAGLELRVRELP